jgi:hypothetical protein
LHSIPSGAIIPRYMRDPTQVVCVLGMHRCGTSLTTRLLGLMGFALGRGPSFNEPVAGNPTGHWEHRALVAINEEILRVLGGTWHQPPLPRSGWEAWPEVAALSHQATELLETEFGGTERWAWKDPRNSLTLPFWQRLTPISAYVICLRSPLDVAISLERRDGLSREHTALAWCRYVASAVAHTAARPRLFLFFDDYFTDCAAQVKTLAAFVGTEPTADIQAAAQAFVDPRLAHSISSTAQLLEAPEIPVAAKVLYLTLRSADDRRAAGGPCPSATAWTLDDLARTYLIPDPLENRHRANERLLRQLSESAMLRVAQGAWALHARLAPSGTLRDRLLRKLLRSTGLRP